MEQRLLSAIRGEIPEDDLVETNTDTKDTQNDPLESVDKVCFLDFIDLARDHGNLQHP